MINEANARIESKLEVKAYLQDLKFALNNGAKIEFQAKRYIDYNRNEKFDDSILRWWNGNKWWEKKHQKECI